MATPTTDWALNNRASMPSTNLSPELAGLRSADARFRALCEQLPVGVFVVNVGDSWTYANPAARQMLGLSPQETLAEGWSRYIYAEDAQNVTEEWQAAAAEQAELVVEYRVQLPGRPLTWVRSHSVPDFDERGELRSFVGNLRDITEERRAAQLLGEQERFFRSIFEQAGVGVGVLDSRTGQFVHVNQKYCDLIGYTPEELKERTFQSLTHPDDLSFNLDMWREMVEGKLRSLSMEKRYVRKDGESVWVHLTITPLWAPGEPPDHHVTIVEDITQRKLAEQQLRESEERFRQLCESAPVGIYLTNAQGQAVYANPRAGEIVGIAPHAALGGGWSALLHPDDRERVIGTWRKAVAEKTTYDNESRYVRPDGRIRRTSSTAIPLRDARGEVTSWVGIIVDVTDEREALDALQQSESQYRDLFNANTDALFLCAFDGRVVEVNDGTCRMMGYTREEFLKLDPREFVHPDYHHLYAEFIETTERGELFHCEAKNVRKDGTVFDIDVHGTKLLYRGEPHAFAIVRDITRRKAAQAELRRQEAMLAHVTRLSTLGEMVAGIAHEVNQPLYSIVNFAKASANLLASDDSAVADDLRSWNDEISASARRAGEIVRRMRDFTRRSAAMRRHEDLGAVLRESLELVQYELRRAKVEVDLQSDDDLPAVAIDRVQIQQVLVNLIKNASEALEGQPEGDRQLQIQLRLAGENLRIDVADNGPGLQKLAGGDPFEPFVTSKPEGMGMGLPISRTIIEAHGGTISARNNDRGGATFTFYIPAARSSS